MRKIVLNVSDIMFERFCFEALHEKKNVQQIINERILTKPFHPDVINSTENWVDEQFQKIINEQLTT